MLWRSQTVKAALLLLAVCLLILLPTPTFALDPDKAISQYVRDVWQDELPQNTVHAITQTSDGYLWLGSYEGLVRFDGVRFTIFAKHNTSGLKSKSILVLMEDHQGNLWIGTLGGGLSCLKDGQFTTYTTADGLPSNTVRAIYQDNQERLWIGTEGGGLSLYQNGKFSNFNSSNGLANDNVRALCQDRAGNLWIGTDQGLCRWREGKFSTYTTKDGLSNNTIWALLEDHTGKLWISTYGGGLNCWQDGKVTVYGVAEGLPNSSTWALWEDRQGNLWVGTNGGGIARYRDGRFTSFNAKQGLSDNTVRSIYEDREGSLWIGTNGGLTRLRDGKLTSYTTQEGLAHDFVRVVYQDQSGAIWFGTDGGGLSRYQDGRFTNYTTKDGMAHDFVRAIYQDRQGNLWIGTNGGGLTRFKDEKFFTYTTRDGLANDNIRAIIEDREGRLWIGTDGGGLCQFNDGKFITYTTKEGLSNNSVRGLFNDRDGNLWVATYGGLSCLKEGKFLLYSSKDGLSSDVVFSFYQDQQGNLWIGTDNGLNCLRNGKFHAFTSKDGLFDDIAFQILEDQQERLWMSCNKGIYAVSKQSLLDYQDGKLGTLSSINFSKADGMGASQCNGGSQPAGWRSSDGRLWFPTIKGAAVIDPNNIRTNQLPPPVIIEQVLIDSLLIDLKQLSELSPGKEKFEFHYTGLSLVSPDRVKFRYLLEGFDKEWVEAGTRRTAYYTNIPPGYYRFKVIACNDDGVWSQATVYQFHLLTPIWRTWWAYLLYLITISSLIYLCVWFYGEQLRRRNQMLEGEVARRTLALAEKVEALKVSQQQALASEQKALASEKRALEASQAKSAFLSNMSHELRTPLNAVIGFAQLMARGEHRNASDREYLGIILRSGEHLLGLINDVLSLAKIEAGKLTLNEQAFDLLRLLQSLEEMFSLRAQSKRLTLNFDISELPQYVLGDEGKLRQVLINLLGNAVKFTNTGTISLQTSNQDDLIEFVVADTGHGISEAELANLFTAFAQTESGQLSREGTGLGLAISRNFVRLMGGEIKVESALGKGSRFSFQLKLPRTSAPRLTTDARKIVGLAPQQKVFRLLMVDDKPENRKLLMLLLAPLGFQVREAADGAEAVQCWQDWQPDLIWMDLRMPVLDGYDATRQIRTMERANNNHLHTVIIALTASAFEHDQAAVRAAGCDDFVTKPFRESLIFDKLTEHLGAEFLYDETIETTPSSSFSPVEVLSPERLAAIPAELLAQLSQALNIGDNRGGLRIVDQINELDEQLAARLRKMIKNLQVDEVLELIERIPT